jgi:hypothetical protein
VFGSGDAKMLSGGIAEALITTEFGLIVAIPALLVHAFLSRRVRAIVSGMEATAVAFMNHVRRLPGGGPPAHGGGNGAAGAAMDATAIRAQVADILREVLGPLVREHEDAVAVNSSSVRPT